jgi:hypothetical protein
MKKAIALLLAVIFLFSACAAEETEPQSEILEEELIFGEVISISEPDDPEPESGNPPDEQDGLEDPQWGTEAYYQRHAVEITQAFAEKDTGFLSQAFGDNSGAGFDFLNELEFLVFELVAEDFIMYRDDTNPRNNYVMGGIFHLNIAVRDGSDDIFTRGGRDWIMHLQSDGWGIVHIFAPSGTEVTTRMGLSDYALMCYHFSNDLLVFDTITDFNSIKENFGGRDYNNWTNYSKNIFSALNRIYSNMELRAMRSADEIMELAAQTFGITNIDHDDLQSLLDSDWAHGWYWHYPSLVSEEITDNGAVIILNYHADMAHFLIAKTMKYTLEFTDTGVRFAAVELLYENDELIMAGGSV